MVYSTDMHPDTPTPWGGADMPCACFLYSRTDYVPYAMTPTQRLAPARSAALAWRHTTLCHISSIMDAIDSARQDGEDDDPHRYAREPAPSFQSSALGPALYLAAHDRLAPLSHADFMHGLTSGDPRDLDALLKNAGLDSGESSSCLARAKQAARTCPGPQVRRGLPWSLGIGGDPFPFTAESLPYALFPPGRSFFTDEREAGAEPVVVHANYASEGWKEKLLRENGLWALKIEPAAAAGARSPSQDILGGNLSCDVDTLKRSAVVGRLA